MNQSILFPDIQTWDAENQCVVFPAQQSGALIECTITLEELGKLAGREVTNEQAIEVFSELRFDLEELAEELIEEEEFNSSGQIEIQAS
ncbi:DUF1488 domain-containing protein [Vibrio fortis]|jgi:phenylalanyl-tRNA synthetase beta subunit|uniref:DUF1488 domain-containing protein n=1 Tax=Vibrio fortis TaxID=212667 RepID=A0A066UUH2_9VIBR|nr:MULTISPECIES: DUF1488 domain-containing protein [Vibrio]KAB0302010.1 DUF1488 domain-containing protein [Vibrio fortis]KDN30720.1 transcriptional regulator [Vibrio fortis]MCG9633402.1 DUF1488 domain-containing protein [Vibrio sp. Isolate30]|tara:strand:+ start:681 stop:947 length:267 start_codon:yes stop_codon:yes gene_type:complete